MDCCFLLVSAAQNKEGVQATTALIAKIEKFKSWEKLRQTALSEAIQCSNLETVKLFVNHGARIKNEDVLCVQVAQEWSTIQLLCRLDPSIIHRPFWSNNNMSFRAKSCERSLLTQCARLGTCSQVRELLDLGATDITAAFFQAICTRNLKKVKLLVDRGANYIGTSPDGKTAFEVACKAGAKKVFNYLLKLDWSRSRCIQLNPERHPQSLTLRKAEFMNFLDMVIHSKWRNPHLMVEGKNPVSYMLSHITRTPFEAPWMLKMLIRAGYSIQGPGPSALEVLCGSEYSCNFSGCFEILLRADVHVPIDPRLDLYTSQKEDVDVAQTEILNEETFLTIHYGMPATLFVQCVLSYPDLTPLLLRFYSGPPLTLMLICAISRAKHSIVFQSDYFYELYWSLACHGLPPGTQAVSRLKSFIAQETAHFGKEEDIQKLKTHFYALLCRPPSLVTLSKFSYRRVLGKLAASSGKALPEVVKTNVPKFLQPLFEYNISSRCVGDKNCLCAEHMR